MLFPERNGAKMEIIYCKHMDNQPGMFFIFCTTDGWWGTLEVFGQRSGAKALIFVRLLYIVSAYVLFYPLSILKCNSYKKRT